MALSWSLVHLFNLDLPDIAVLYNYTFLSFNPYIEKHQFLSVDYINAIFCGL